MPNRAKYGVRSNRNLVLFLFGICLSLSASATHFMGGEITYECLGGNQYLVTLNAYRDCAGARVEATQPIDVNSASCGMSAPLTLALVSSQEVSQLCPADLPNSSCNGGFLPGVEEYLYQGVVTLPGECTDWTLSRSLNNRNGAITNLTASSDQQMYIESIIDNTNNKCSNSPVFTSLPVPYVCVGEPVSYNHGAIDDDGDSLVFELTNPLGSADLILGYEGGLSATNPMETSSGFDFSTSDGSMSFIPSVAQIGVVTVRVTEYRNGDFMGSVMRDVQVIVQDCANDPPKLANGGITNLTGGGNLSTPKEIEVCPGEDISFSIVIDDANAANTVTLASNIERALPGATYQVTGTNPTTMDVQWLAPGNAGLFSFNIDARDDDCPLPGLQVFTFNVNVLTGTTAGTDKYYCIGDKPVTLDGSGGSAWTWSPPDGLSCTDCKNPVATPDATTVYTLTSNLSGSCTNTDQVTVNVTAGTPVLTDPIGGNFDGICPGGETEVYSVNQTAGSTYEWELPLGGTIISGQGTNTIEVNWYTEAIGDIQVVETNSDGCSGYEVTQDVIIQGPPSEPIVGPDFICKPSLGDGAHTVYETSGPPSVDWPWNNPPNPTTDPGDAGRSYYDWEVTFGTANFDSGSKERGEVSQQISFENYEGPVILKVTEVDDEGCRHVPSTKEINVVARPSPAVISGPKQVCPGQEYTFTATTGDDFLWDFDLANSGIEIVRGDSTSAVTVIWGNETTTLEVYTGKPECPAPSGSVYLVEVFDIDLTSLNSTYTGCGVPFRMENWETGRYLANSREWIVPPGFTVISGGTTGSAFIELVQDDPDCFAGEVCLAVQNAQGCYDTLCEYIPGNLPPCTFPGPVSINTSEDTLFCGGQIELTASPGVTPPIAGFDYRFVNEAGDILTNSDSDKVMVDTAGMYRVFITDLIDSTTCRDSSDWLTIVAVEDSLLLTDTVICPGDLINLEVPGFTDYSWSTGESTSAISVAVEGSYVLSVTSSKGCDLSDTIAVAPDTDCSVCAIDAGTMAADSLAVCPGDSIIGAHNVDQQLEDGDTLLFVLHDGSDWPVGQVLAVDTVPVFPFPDTLTVAAYYYISAVAGVFTDSLGSIWQTDCWDSTLAQVAYLGIPPSATITLDSASCPDQEVEVSMTLTGQGPFSFGITYPDRFVQVDNWPLYDFTGDMTGEVGWNTIKIEDLVDAGGCPADSITAQHLVRSPPVIGGEVVRPSCFGPGTGELHIKLEEFNAYTTVAVSQYDIVFSNDTTVTGLGVGEYTVEVSQYGCVNDTVFNLQASDGVQVDVDTIIHNSCWHGQDGQIILIPASDTYTFIWSNGSTEVSQDSLGPGYHGFVATDTAGCIYNETYLIEAADTIRVEANAEGEYCLGDDLVMRAALNQEGADYNIAWTHGGGQINEGETFTWSITDITQFEVTARSEDGCLAIPDTIVLDPVPAPTAELLVDATTVCPGDEVRLQVINQAGGMPDYSYQWPHDILINKLTDSADVRVDSSSWWAVQLLDLCQQVWEDSIYVETYDTVRPVLSPIFEIGCDSSLVTWELSHLPSEATCYWELSDRVDTVQGCDDQQSTHFSFEQATAVVTVVDDNACITSNVDSFDVELAPYPDLDIVSHQGTLTTLLGEGSFEAMDLDGDTNLAYTWSALGMDTVAGATMSFDFTGDSIGEFEVRAIGVNSYGCADTAYTVVDILGDFVVYVPNTFSPNGDGLNDVLSIHHTGLGGAMVSFLVFDRWGEQIFVGETIESAWDGTFKNTGAMVKQDVYTWQLTVLKPGINDGQSIERRGKVTVRR